MVWVILLAHFLADYPLQTPWILRNKRRSEIVAIHAGIHLALMLILVGPERTRLWPFLSLLAGVHLFIDLGKNVVYKIRPDWVVAPYIVDQCLHYVTIGITSAWIQAALGITTPPFGGKWAVFATSYLVVMYVWFISERIIVYASPSYQAEVQAQYWPRMLSRGALLTLLLLTTAVPVSTTIATASTAFLPYISGKHRLRAVVTDAAVVCTIWVFIRIAIG